MKIIIGIKTESAIIGVLTDNESGTSIRGTTIDGIVSSITDIISFCATDSVLAKPLAHLLYFQVYFLMNFINYSLGGVLDIRIPIYAVSEPPYIAVISPQCLYNLPSIKLCRKIIVPKINNPIHINKSSFCKIFSLSIYSSNSLISKLK